MKTKTALISYDLQNVTPVDNLNVKLELLRAGASSILLGYSKSSPTFAWVKLPDTTVLVEVVATATATDIVNDVEAIIQSQGAAASRIVVGFVTDFLAESY